MYRTCMHWYIQSLTSRNKLRKCAWTVVDAISPFLVLSIVLTPSCSFLLLLTPSCSLLLPLAPSSSLLLFLAPLCSLLFGQSRSQHFQPPVDQSLRTLRSKHSESQLDQVSTWPSLHLTKSPLDQVSSWPKPLFLSLFSLPFLIPFWYHFYC